MTDNVNHPAHYASKFRTKPIECIDITRHLGFCAGNAFKYVWRAGDKGDNKKAVEDIEKAEFYLDDLKESGISVVDETAQAVFDLIDDDGSDRYQALRYIVYGEFSDAWWVLDSMKAAFIKGQNNG